MRDIFICHASEDKDAIVRPLVEAFNEAGISCWYDEAEIAWGDSITQKVNDGLAKSRYVLVVLSPAFVGKNWPQRELNSILNQEASTGEVKVLPLLVGTEQEKKQILEQFPLLNDKRYLPWGGQVGEIVNALRSRLGNKGNVTGESGFETPSKSQAVIPLPKIKKLFTQRDKDMFLKSGFIVIKQYFQNALSIFESQSSEVQTDFTEVDSSKFTATVYVRGEVANRCKIWVGGMVSSGSIAYSEGRHQVEGDNSINDQLFVEHNDQTLGFKPLGLGFGMSDYSGKGLLTAEQAAEYLWQRFIKSMRQ